MNNLDHLIVLPRLKVQNANAVSSPLTWGFPAVTAFYGFTHALQRKLTDNLKFFGVGIICHNFSPQVTAFPGRFSQVFNLTRNPLTKEGATAALVEEGRAHLEVSLVIAAQGQIHEKRDFIQQITQLMQAQRLAGGTVLVQGSGKRHAVSVHSLPRSEEKVDEYFQRIKRQLLPGFALVHQERRIDKHLKTLLQENPNANSLDALLDLIRLNFNPNPDAKSQDDVWTINKEAGWVVPIPIGYAGISTLYGAGEVQNARDTVTPFRFVECLYSLGEWVSPHRLTSLSQLLWTEKTDVEKGLYVCENSYSA